MVKSTSSFKGLKKKSFFFINNHYREKKKKKFFLFFFLSPDLPHWIANPTQPQREGGWLFKKNPVSKNLNPPPSEPSKSVVLVFMDFDSSASPLIMAARTASVINDSGFFFFEHEGGLQKLTAHARAKGRRVQA